MQSAKDGLVESIDAGPMRPFQVVAVGLCVILNMLDGFDVLVMAFSAAEVAREWGLSGKWLGLLLSAGLFGMAAGSLFLAPLGDRFGRRAMILVSLALLTAGMVLSAISRGPIELGALRVITGLGIGSMLASISVISSEYASLKWRSASVSLQATGYPIGATIGGIIAAWLMAHYGWRSIFLFGGIVSALLVPLVLIGIPESLDYLLAKRPANALRKLNRLLGRLGQQPLERLPAFEPTFSGKQHSRLIGLFRHGLAASTLRIWVGFFMVMLCFYFVLSWTPRLLVAAGMSTQQGITGGVLLNIGGIVGGTVFAWLSVRGSLKTLSAISLLLAAAALAAYGYVSGHLSSAFVLALLSGMFVFASMVSLYALTPQLYGPAVRTTGMGWAIGIGRIGAILAPIIAGVLVDKGWQASHLYYLFAVPMLIAMVSISGLSGPSRDRAMPA